MLIIRESQMAALRRDRIARFDYKALAHVRKYFPEQCAAVGDDIALAYVREGLARARSYGLISEYDLLRFLNVMFTLGSDFDSNRQYAWVRPVLDNRAAPATTRMNEIMDEIFVRVFPPEPSELPAASEPDPTEFDGIVWGDSVPADYVPQSHVPEVQPYAPRPPLVVQSIVLEDQSGRR
jgi:hypothetical protein